MPSWAVRVPSDINCRPLLPQKMNSLYDPVGSHVYDIIHSAIHLHALYTTFDTCVTFSKTPSGTPGQLALRARAALGFCSQVSNSKQS